MHPALQVITPDNKGPAVVVVRYACVITSILLTAIRVISAAVLRRGTAWDDVSIVLGTVSLAVSPFIAGSINWNYNTEDAIANRCLLWLKQSWQNELLTLVWASI
jgi:hypothetical protein